MHRHEVNVTKCSREKNWCNRNSDICSLWITFVRLMFHYTHKSFPWFFHECEQKGELKETKSDEQRRHFRASSTVLYVYVENECKKRERARECWTSKEVSHWKTGETSVTNVFRHVILYGIGMNAQRYTRHKVTASNWIASQTYHHLQCARAHIPFSKHFKQR